jgi:arylsulfatase A-like enzyme
MIRNRLILSGLTAFFLLSVQQTATANEKRPNVLIFLTDDTGWAEYGFQGCKDIATPNIDALAKAGTRFTQGYVSGPYCSPTRAGLMTGRYQTRFGHEFNSTAQVSGLKLDEKTIAEYLKAEGYNTCAIGKWHLGSKEEFRPYNRGFDEFFGTLANTPFFHPTNFIDTLKGKTIQQIDDKNFYTTRAYADRAVDWLGRNEGKPWFLYVPFNAQHAPLQAPEELLAKFAHIKDETRRYFAAMMTAKDEAVGKILKKVADMGEENNTIVFFLADNGGPTAQTTSNNLPLNGFKATTWEGGVRVPFCAKWPGKIPAGKDYSNPIIQLDILPTVLAATGAKVKPAKPLDGVNLLPYLSGENKGKPHESLYWKFGQQWAVRKGDWKLVVARGGSMQPELYNLADDIGEKKNLASEMPDVLASLQADYKIWLAEQAPASVPSDTATKKAAGKKATAKKKGTIKKAG